MTRPRGTQASTPSKSAQTVTLPQAIEIALGHHAAGRLAEAEALYRQVLQVQPEHGDALHLLGVIAHQRQQYELAQQLIGRALVSNPKAASYLVNLGNAQQAAGALDAALASYRQALALQPNFAEAHNNLGNALQALQQFEAAEACYRQALVCQAAYPEAYNNLGLALARQGRYEAALAAYRAALALDPGYPEPHNNLANALQALDQFEPALEHYRQALALRPTYAQAHNNLGTAWQELGHYQAAAECYQQALAVQPGFAEAHNNLGNTRSRQGDLPAALQHFREALALQPEFDLAHSNLLFHLNYHALSTPADYLQEASRFGARVARRAQPYAAWPRARAADGQPLRVGLVSGDLHRHPVGYFLEDVLANLDPQQVSVTAYVTTPRRDEVTERIQAECSAWRSLVGHSDADAARLIHEDGIQILIDLAGHTADNRLPMFAWRPAPVQMAWLGYFASTGVAALDYILADAQVLPEHEQAHFVEQARRMPDCYLCFTPPAEPIEVGSLPLLHNGYVTFGCFNKLGKMNDAVVALWARVLHAVPGSRLLLKARELTFPELHAATLARFASLGIGAERLILEGHTPRADYLAAYRRVDMALDPFPFTGGTTTAEALWMGVPVLTRRGDRFVSHAGESLLGTAGLAAWIAADDAEYVALAQRWAGDVAGLAATRASLRAQLLASPLCDAPRYARHLTQILQQMWQDYLTAAKVPA